MEGLEGGGLRTVLRGSQHGPSLAQGARASGLCPQRPGIAHVYITVYAALPCVPILAPPVQIKVLCNGLIDTLGRMKLPSSWKGPFTAHPKLDPETGACRLCWGRVGGVLCRAGASDGEHERLLWG